MPSSDVTFDLLLRAQDPEIVTMAAQAHVFAMVIREIPLPPSVQRSIDALNMLRAVRGTTGIEGSDLSEDEVRQVLEAKSETAVLSRSREREEKEIKNADEVMQYVSDLLSKHPNHPLTEDFIKEIHRLTTKGINYPNNVPGRYRRHAVHALDYQPPSDGDTVQQLMTAFVEWFNSGQPRNWDPVLQALVAHFYVISIHPFGDGNGRTARGVESFLLYQGGVNVRGFYSLANCYYRERNQYVELLDYVRFQSRGDLTPFVRFGLRGLVEELESVHKEILEAVRQIMFRDYAQHTLLFGRGRISSKTRGRMMALVQFLESQPVGIDALETGQSAIAVMYKSLSARTRARDLKQLRKLGLIKTRDGEISANLDIMSQFTAGDLSN